MGLLDGLKKLVTGEDSLATLQDDNEKKMSLYLKVGIRYCVLIDFSASGSN